MNIIKQIIDAFKKQSEPDADVLAEYAQLQKRNIERMDAIKKAMGEKWLHHSANRKSRLDTPRPV